MDPTASTGGGCFSVCHRDGATHARSGILKTTHGEVLTPVFMPVGTRGSVKGIWPGQLKEAGSSIILANTYHLALRPGAEEVARMGGLHSFCNWTGPMLTDSGGFQVFSLKNIRTLGEEGVSFRSHLDGALLELSPESAIRIQEDLGADIIMALDECPALPCEDRVMDASLERTARWLIRCKEAQVRGDQLLFGIVQGGVNGELRLKSLALTLKAELPGIAIGGLSVGESREARLAVLDTLAPALPESLPHYLMGVGTPLDLMESVARGIDMFDCVLPTRDGRHGLAFTSTGRLRIRNEEHRSSAAPLDDSCPCLCCRSFSRAYLRHLVMSGEALGSMALSLHNVSFYHTLMARARASIEKGNFGNLLEETRRMYPPEQKK
ncbi:MAG: tRNA guanosine(34) transglycosylase Tgt [Planctomycetes bacterium]|nr:tRNA guanosine(34) transglycosylase Tgt [Planctomycetota bacterium]